MFGVQDLIVVGPRTPVEQQRVLQRGAENGLFHRLRRGVYLPMSVWQAMGEPERAVALMAALAAVSADQPIFSHWSAALLLGLPAAFTTMTRVDRIIPGGPLPSQPGVITHRLPIGPGDVTVERGLRCTTLLRTVGDLAAAEPFELGVTVADAALRAIGRGSEPGREMLTEAWELGLPRRGAGRARAVIAFADARAETPIESRSRVTMHRLGLAAPVLQHEFADRDGFIARVDFWHPDQRGIGEADGAVKLLDAQITRGDPGRALLNEKRREDRLRLVSSHFARWGWSVAVSTERLGRRLADAGFRIP